MIYGYVNRHKGETEDFLNGREFDEIFYQDKTNYDLSFLKPGDTIILCRLKSISDNLKDILVFSQYTFDNEIEVLCIDKNDDKYIDFIDTSTAMGKLIIGLWAGINRLDDEYYRNSENN